LYIMKKKLYSLINNLMPQSERCAAQEYVSGTCEVAACIVMIWKGNETFILQLGPQDTTDVPVNEEIEEVYQSEFLQTT